MLRDLTIKNYRSFKNFYVEGLTQVNLIVGMNNSGKTSLLEAIYLLACGNALNNLGEILHRRGEVTTLSASAPVVLSDEYQRLSGNYQHNITHIFHGHELHLEKAIYLRSSKENPLTLEIVLNPWERDFRGYENSFEADTPIFDLSLISSRGKATGISITDHGLFSINNFISASRLLQGRFSFITGSLSFEELIILWDSITLTPKEESVIKALQILDPNVERINFTSRNSPHSGILLKLRGHSNPIPLGSMGDGMRRILTLVMAAVTSENNVLLVDDIHTGLHYQTQADMWRLVLEVAKQLNVQIFATTHSWDCISAFQEALTQVEDSSVGKLWRLSRRGEEIRAVEYTAEDLSTAVHQSIEVR